MVIFDKKKVKTIAYNAQVAAVINEQPTILEGQRNLTDGLWDTTLYSDPSVYKTSITENNFQLPNIHPNVYFTNKPCNTVDI